MKTINILFAVLAIAVLSLSGCAKEKVAIKREGITITLPDTSLLPAGSSITISGVPGIPVEVIANDGDVFEVMPDETAAMLTPSEGSMIVGWWMAKGKTKFVKPQKDEIVLIQMVARLESPARIKDCPPGVYEEGCNGVWWVDADPTADKVLMLPDANGTYECKEWVKK